MVQDSKRLKQDYKNLSQNYNTKKKTKSTFWQKFSAFKEGLISFIPQKKDPARPSSILPKRQVQNIIAKKKPRNILTNITLFFVYLITLPVTALWKLTVLIYSSLQSFFKVRSNLVKLGFVLIFFSIAFRLAQLQLFGIASPLSLQKSSDITSNGEIVLARRGQILISDISQNKTNIPVTSTQIQTDIFIDAANLQNLVVQKGLDLDATIMELTSRINLSYTDVLNRVKTEINKAAPNKHFVIAVNVSSDKKQATEFLIASKLNTTYNFQYWLGLTDKQRRSYPENKLLSTTIGYTPPFMVPSNEIQSNMKDCRKMVSDNQARGTDSREYMVGFYGIEQKFCSELGGLNGRRYFGYTSDSENTQVLNGADVYLTIDKNLQQKAEQVLDKAVKNTTNSKGGPVNGTVVVMEAKTGKIRAMASYPTYDPNEYQKYWELNPLSFRNFATSEDYEVGSVMKPLTMAAALNAYESNTVVNNERKGVPTDFKFSDYGAKGKPYQEINGSISYLRNADSRVFGSNLGLKEIIRDSINTGVSDIVDATGSRVLNEYFLERYKFGKSTAVNLPGDQSGNVTAIDRDLFCPICYANFGFGQGFLISPIQLIRAYTVFSNDGFIIEPYLVDSIKYKDGRVDDGSDPSSKIARDSPKKIISSNVVKSMNSYMQSVVDEGFLGTDPSTSKVQGYNIAGKTGTSQVGRGTYGKSCNAGEFIYDCNTRLGIYDHTFIGFGPVKNPEYIVLVKLAEPNPGVVKNYSGTTVGVPFGEMMSYALNYKGVPRDY
jgi:cell division protein FtsI/penicillin-binding protein 2